LDNVREIAGGLRLDAFLEDDRIKSSVKCAVDIDAEGGKLGSGLDCDERCGIGSKGRYQWNDWEETVLGGMVIVGGGHA